jgi:pimeloyl-ACP methyl ester carboxylesterase
MTQTSTLYNRSAIVPKALLATVKILEATAPKLAIKFAIRLFTTPIKHKLPKREAEMDVKSTQHRVLMQSLNETINVYTLGDSPKKILLIHGWSGRGTQLCSIADALVKEGYSTISFDAPAHGKSTGKRSDMTEFVACILQLEQDFGPFEFAIGHSLGAMALLNAIKRGLTVQRAVTIGSGDIIKDIMDSFWQKLGMNVANGNAMIKRFENKFGQSINNYSAYIAAQEVTVPVLVIHDEDDDDVPVSAAHHIMENLPNGTLLITKGLGHRKILGDKAVIKQITTFLQL